MIPDDWKQLPVYMMDFEGSALSGVVEFGVAVLEGGAIRSTHTAMCRPTGVISARDREVHGIGEAETRDRTPFSECYKAFVAFRRRGIFAAHNRHAENAFLKATWALPPTVPDWRAGRGEAQEWGPWIDTLSIYRRLYTGLDSYGLGELVELFQCAGAVGELAEKYCPIGRRRAHCALYDAIASSLLLLRLESVEGLEGLMTTRWLLQMSSEQNSQQELF